ncbi:unnamed protein product [Symbiodinium sp. CCMP2592]|nr:unnamed protein product [Symbiodinium sp. CCMP2592]
MVISHGALGAVGLIVGLWIQPQRASPEATEGLAIIPSGTPVGTLILGLLLAGLLTANLALVLRVTVKRCRGTNSSFARLTTISTWSRWMQKTLTLLICGIVGIIASGRVELQAEMARRVWSDPERQRQLRLQTLYWLAAEDGGTYRYGDAVPGVLAAAVEGVREEQPIYGSRQSGIIESFRSLWMPLDAPECSLKEVAEKGEQIPDLQMVPCLSDGGGLGTGGASKALPSAGKGRQLELGHLQHFQLSMMIKAALQQDQLDGNNNLFIEMIFRRLQTIEFSYADKEVAVFFVTKKGGKLRMIVDARIEADGPLTIAMADAFYHLELPAAGLRDEARLRDRLPVLQSFKAAVDQLKEAGLQVHEEEISNDGAKVLGWEIHPGGRFGPSLHRAWKVRLALRELLRPEKRWPEAARDDTSQHRDDSLVGRLCKDRSPEEAQVPQNSDGTARVIYSTRCHRANSESAEQPVFGPGGHERCPSESEEIADSGTGGAYSDMYMDGEDLSAGQYLIAAVFFFCMVIKAVVALLAQWGFSNKRLAVALHMLLNFMLSLRPTEARWCKDLVCPALRQRRYRRWTVVLHPMMELEHSSKTQFDETLQLILDYRDKVVEAVYRVLRLSRNPSLRDLSDFVERGSVALGLRALGPLHPYRLRHRGASHDFSQIQLRGPWRSQASVRSYQKGGRFFASLPEKVQQEAISAANDLSRLCASLR